MREKCYSHDEQGYALVIFMILMALGALVVSSSLHITSSHARTVYATKARSQRLYSTETAVSVATSWLRDTSENLVSPFTRDTFYTKFVRIATSVGDNDVDFEVASKLRVYGSNDTPILTNSTLLATANFPMTTHITTGDPFDPVAEFNGIDFGGMLVKVTLVDAVAMDPSKDYGPPPAAAPQTDFYPVFRVDVMSKVDQGAHVYGYILGSLAESTKWGFHGEDFVDIQQDCDSYNSDVAAYTGATMSVSCPVSSGGTICLDSGIKVYGEVNTSNVMDTAPSCSGKVCPDATCASPTSACEGSSCSTPIMPEFSDWNSYCPPGFTQGDYPSPDNVIMPKTVASAAPISKCWDTVTGGMNGTLRLSTTTYPYFFKTLDLKSKPNSVMDFVPTAPRGTIELYVQNITGNEIKASEISNFANKPTNFKIYYLGTAALAINLDTSMKAGIMAPYAAVTVTGTGNYHGGIMAKSLVLQSSGELHSDEDMLENSLSNVSFQLRQVSQFYR